MSTIIEQIISWALALVSKFGYGGIFFTMMLESAAVPIPSEIVLPFSGFLASSGRLHFWFIVLAATLANLSGALIIYYIGLAGGRPLFERYGKYVLVHRDDISKMDSWLVRYGSSTAFFSRLLPGVRTFSSLVFGAGRVKIKKFIFYTVAGSFIWNFALIYVGLIAGNNWNFLQPYFHKFELVILALVVIAVILFVFKQVRKFGRFSKHPEV